MNGSGKNWFKISSILILSIIIILSCTQIDNKYENMSTDYAELTALFKEWREFEKPPMREGAPDYTKATFDARHPEFKRLRARLHNFDIRNWSVEQKVDWYVVLAEINGYDFNYRILKPWERDPAFYKSFWTYKSDTPAHEGPTHHMVTEIWSYKLPLSDSEKQRLIGDLNVIPPLNEQAKMNLTGNAKDLWIAGIRDIRSQRDNMKNYYSSNEAELSDLKEHFQKAIDSSDELVEWLEEKAKTKTGPSGIGKENYTWYQQNVHLVPLTWEDEVMILKRELARSWASLKLEEHRNRNLPQAKEVKSAEEYDD